MLRKQTIKIISPMGQSYEIAGDDVVETMTTFNVYLDTQKISFNKSNLRGRGQKFDGWRIELGEMKAPKPPSGEINSSPIIKVEDNHLWMAYRQIATKFYKAQHDRMRYEANYFAKGIMTEEFRQALISFNELFDQFKEAHDAFYSR